LKTLYIFKVNGLARILCILFVFAACPAGAQPRFSFGVLTDIQYGDQESKGKRDYRSSLGKLREAVAALNAEPLAFAIQLGDLIDSRGEDLTPILEVFDRLKAPRYHVLGNHDFSAGRDGLVPRLTRSAWYRFDGFAEGWRFLVTDGMDVSAHDPAGVKMLDSLRAAGARNAQDWNGAIGSRQMSWLGRQLEDADAAHERVIVFCHFPLIAESSTPAHLLWNHDEVVALLEKHPSVAAWFNGHDHAGGYAERDGIHYVTFPGMVESGTRNSYSVVRVFDRRIEIEGSGSAPRRTLNLRGR
jgi:hypothetical protein